jgi:hypothetical protein
MTMTDTIQEFKTLAAAQTSQMRERKERAIALYSEIMGRLDQPHADDAAALAEAVEILNLTPEMVDADALAAQNLRSALARVVDDAEIEVMREKFGAADLAVDKAVAKWEAELRKLRDARDNAQRAIDFADVANRRARETEAAIRRSSPRLFGALEAPPTPEDPKPFSVYGGFDTPPTKPGDGVARPGADFNGQTTWATKAQI